MAAGPRLLRRAPGSRRCDHRSARVTRPRGLRAAAGSLGGTGRLTRAAGDDVRSDVDRCYGADSSTCLSPPVRRAGSRRSAMSRLVKGWEGRYFEDFQVGDVYRCRYGRTVTEADNIWFTLLTNNTNQIHFNREYGKKTQWGRCLINSALTIAIVAGMGVADVSENGFALGWDEIKLPNPLFDGDTLYTESEVLDVRESRSRPEQGIVRVRTRGFNQHGQIVIEYARTVMVWKRENAPRLDIFPVPEPSQD